MSKIKSLFTLLAIVGGVFLFILIAPFLIWGVAMLILGGIALSILCLLVYATWEWLTEK